MWTLRSLRSVGEARGAGVEFYAEPCGIPMGPTCQNAYYRWCGKRGLKLPSAA